MTDKYGFPQLDTQQRHVMREKKRQWKNLKEKFESVRQVKR